MEKKEKPQVPAKPRTLSVTEKARNFERIAAEIAARKPMKIQRSFSHPSDATESDTGNNIVESMVESVHMLTVESGDIDVMNGEHENADSLVDSSDDSIYYESPEDFGEHIYDEIPESKEVTNTVEEILAIEESYIDKLNFVIENYVEPSRLMGDQMKAVFGNIEEIKHFHEFTFYPDVKRCNKDLLRILQCFSKHITAGNFYIYVVYAMNKKRSDEERNKPAFKSFFLECQDKIGDKLGLHSLLTEPFQRFFKYQNLIESVLKKIRNNELNFMEIAEIAATSKALHDVKSLLNTANKSMALTEVVDSKINLMKQGNFLTQNEFSIFDYNHKRKYKGNIFLFQNCVVATERLSSGKLQFKGYFPSETSHIECINKNKFLLYERNNYKIDVTGEASVIPQMMEQIRQVFRNNEENRMSTISSASSTKSSESKVSPRITRDLESLIGSIKRSASSDSLDVLRDKEPNITFVESRKSNSDGSSVDSGEFGGSQSDDHIEKEQFKQMIKNLDRFYEKVVTKNLEPATTSEEIIHIPVQETYADIIQEMLTNERDYISQLKIGIQTYLAHDHISITEAFRGKILKIFGNLQQIRDFHEHSFHFNLKDCENDLIKIANVFIKFTQEGLFSNYVLYAMNHNNSQTLRNMRPYREFFELRQKDTEESQTVEYYLYLPFQHLSKYQCFMDRIINTLDINNDREIMAACSKAVKNIERLIKDMHSSCTTPDVQVRKRPIRKLSNLVLNGIQNMRRH